MKHGVGNDLTVNIDGGTFSGLKALYQADPNADKAGTVTMKVTGGTFNAAVTAATVAKFISGGTFAEGVDETYLADGYVYNAADNTVKADTSVAKIGDTKYATLAEAIKAAQNGETVTLLKDITLSSAQSISSKKLTLDLNGKTLSSTAYQTIKLNSNADLTVKDSVGGGKISNAWTKTSGESAAVYLSGTDSQFTLNSGTIESTSKLTSLDSVAIRNKSGQTCTVNINGGSVVVPKAATDGRAIVAGENMTLNVSGGTIAGGLHGVDAYSGSNVTITGGEITARVVDTGVIKEAYGMRITGTANVTVDGGTITGVKMEDNGTGVPNVELKSGHIEGSVYAIGSHDITFTVAPDAEITFANDTVKKFLPDTVELVQKTPGTYGVEKAKVYVAEVNGTQYESLQAAIDAASRKTTVTMLANTKENVTISTSDLTLDLNGFTLNGGTVAGKPALTVTARVTVKDSSTAQTGTIKREDTAENSGDSSHYVIDVQDNGWLTFEGGNVKNNSGIVGVTGASLVRVGDDSVAKYPGLTIKGGTFTQDNFIVIKVDRGDLFLNGGTLSSKNSYAIENWHRATVKGGTVNGTVAALTYSGGQKSDLTISGGTINGNVSSVNYDNAAGKTAKVAINGGTINGELGTYTYNTTDKT